MTRRLQVTTAAAALFAASGFAMAQHDHDENVIVKEIVVDGDGRKYEVLVERDDARQAEKTKKRQVVTRRAKEIDVHDEDDNVFVRRLGGGDGQVEIIVKIIGGEGDGDGRETRRRMFFGDEGGRFELRGDGGEWIERGDGDRRFRVLRRGGGVDREGLRERIIRLHGDDDHDVRVFRLDGGGGAEKLHKQMMKLRGEGGEWHMFVPDENEFEIVMDAIDGFDPKEMHEHFEHLHELEHFPGVIQMEIDAGDFEGLHELRGLHKLEGLHERLEDLGGVIEMHIDAGDFEGLHELGGLFEFRVGGEECGEGGCCEDEECCGECGDEHEHEHDVEHVSDFFFEVDEHAEGAQLFGRAGQPEISADSVMTIVTSDDEGECKVEIRGDAVRAWIDGDEIADECIEADDNVIIILSEDGEVMHEFDRSFNMPFGAAAPEGFGGEFELAVPNAFVFSGGGEGEAPIVWADQPEAEVAWIEEGDGVAFSWAPQPEDHPPVMIGINMGPLEEGELDDALIDILESRDLGGDDVIVVLGVIDGLPAKKAGVREGDVIVRIDGHWGVDAEDLRDVLNDKKPGDELELLVVRDGKRREIGVKLQAFDAGRLMIEAPIAIDIPDNEFFADDAWDENEDVMRLLERLSRDNNQIDAAARERIAEAMEQLQRGRRMELDRLPRLRMDAREPEAPRAFIEPRRLEFNRQAPGEQSVRIDQLEERLDRLESRLDRIIEMLERRERDR